MDQKKKLAFIRTLQLASTSCMAADMKMKTDPAKTTLNKKGYALYCELVQAQLADGSFMGPLSHTSLLPFTPMTLGGVFANNLDALSSCISHSCLMGSDLDPIVHTLQQVHDACAGRHFEGRVLAAFGLGRFYWEAGDRERAAAFYADGVRGGRDAAAQGIALGDYASSSYRTCQENLDCMRGIPLPPGSAGGVSTKAFFTGRPGALPKPDMDCCAPGCTDDAATELCTGCRAARYCSQQCQKKAWPTHKEACKKAQAEAAALAAAPAGPGAK